MVDRLDGDIDTNFASVMKWISDLTQEPEPTYSADTRRRDAWLRRWWRKEPHIAGVLNSVVLIDKNRGWSLVGPQRQVNRQIAILHGSERGKGWHRLIRLSSLAFHESDLGGVIAIGRDGEDGPYRELYHVDSVACKLSGKEDYPLDFYPRRGKKIALRPDDFMLLTSMPSADRNMLQAGYCAVSRAIELTKMMVGVLTHDQEELGARAPRGMLVLKGVSQEQWDQAMRSRETELDGDELKYYGAVAVLAGFQEIDAKLIALSNLPVGFDRKVFTDLLMYGLALCFGYPPDEFWPVQYGSLGRGSEVQMQHRRATTKGAGDFSGELQENIQKVLPDSVEFTFDERDSEGEMMDAQLEQAQAGVIKSLYDTGGLDREPLITREEARFLLAQKGLIPGDWTEADEDVTANEEDSKVRSIKRFSRLEALRDRYRENWRIQIAAEETPNDPIIHYSYRHRSSNSIVLWEKGSQINAATRKLYTGHKLRADDPILYGPDENGVVIYQSDVDTAIQEASRRTPALAEIISAETMSLEEAQELGG